MKYLYSLILSLFILCGNISLAQTPGNVVTASDYYLYKSYDYEALRINAMIDAGFDTTLVVDTNERQVLKPILASYSATETWGVPDSAIVSYNYYLRGIAVRTSKDIHLTFYGKHINSRWPLADSLYSVLRAGDSFWWEFSHLDSLAIYGTEDDTDVDIYIRAGFKYTISDTLNFY